MFILTTTATICVSTTYFRTSSESIALFICVGYSLIKEGVKDEKEKCCRKNI